MIHVTNVAPELRRALWLTLWGCLAWSPSAAAQSELRATHEWKTAGVSCVAISPDGRRVAAGVTGNKIQLWSVASGKEQARLETGYDVYSVAFSPDGKKLAAAMAYNNVKLWDVATGACMTLLHHAKPKPKVQSILEFASPIVVVSPNGKILASGGKCIGDIRLWDATTGKQAAVLDLDDPNGIRALAFGPDGKTLASMGADGAIRLWDWATRKNTVTQQIVDWTPAAAFSPDTKTLATVQKVEGRKGDKAVTEYSVKLWETATRKELATLKIEWGGAMTFSSDGKTFACGRDNGTIEIWNVLTGKQLASRRAHTGAVGSLAFSANGNLLVSGSGDKTVKLWELSKEK